MKDLADLKFNSALLRRILKVFYHEGDICKVRTGPLRGARLVYHSSVNFHAILGLWDLNVFRFLQTTLFNGGLLKPDSIIADVGANIGFYSLWFSRHFHSVYAFEPAPEPQRILSENLEINAARNVQMIKVACGASDGTVDFFVSHHHHSSSLHADWAQAGNENQPNKITVPVVTLDSYFSQTVGSWPDMIKMDIEGGGTFALPGAARCFAEKRPFVLIESHTPDEDRAISQVLTANDYNAYRFDTSQWVRERGETHPNPNGVWGTMFLCPGEKRSSVESRMARHSR